MLSDELTRMGGGSQSTQCIDSQGRPTVTELKWGSTGLGSPFIWLNVTANCGIS